MNTENLERTSGEIRDRAVAEANALRQENAELRIALRAFLDGRGNTERALALLRRSAP